MSIIWSAHVQDVPFDVHQLRMLKDNFAYIIASGGHAIAIDVSDGPCLLEVLEKHQLTLDAFLTSFNRISNL